MLLFLVPCVFSVPQHLQPLHWLLHSGTAALCGCLSTELLLPGHQLVLHPKIQNQQMRRVRVVAAQNFRGFEQQGLFSARKTQVSAFHGCKNVFALSLAKQRKNHHPSNSHLYDHQIPQKTQQRNARVTEKEFFTFRPVRTHYSEVIKSTGHGQLLHTSRYPKRRSANRRKDGIGCGGMEKG